MLKQIKANLIATKIFFVVRFVTSFLVGVVYFLLTAGIQYLFVSIMGKSTFNYIVGGVLALIIGAVVCTQLGRVLFWFVRGWHISALAYAGQINKKKLPALDIGIAAFGRHFTSFASVYGFGILVSNFVKPATSSVWDIIEDVPIIGGFAKYKDKAIVRHVSSDILDTAFDALIYYLVRYTSPGVGDDVKQIAKAMYKYLRALPQILVASIASFISLYFVPKTIAVIVVLFCFASGGIVSGVTILILLFPMFYILHHTIFEPLESVILLSAFSAYCRTVDEESDDDSFREKVNSILCDMGLDSFVSVQSSDVEAADVESTGDKITGDVSSGIRVKVSSQDPDGLMRREELDKLDSDDDVDSEPAPSRTATVVVHNSIQSDVLQTPKKSRGLNDLAASRSRAVLSSESNPTVSSCQSLSSAILAAKNASRAEQSLPVSSASSNFDKMKAYIASQDSQVVQDNQPTQSSNPGLSNSSGVNSSAQKSAFHDEAYSIDDELSVEIEDASVVSSNLTSEAPVNRIFDIVDAIDDGALNALAGSDMGDDFANTMSGGDLDAF